MIPGMLARPIIWTPWVRTTGGMIWVVMAAAAGPTRAPPNDRRKLKTISVQIGGIVDRAKSPRALINPNDPTIMRAPPGVIGGRPAVKAPPVKAPRGPPPNGGGAQHPEQGEGGPGGGRP